MRVQFWVYLGTAGFLLAAAAVYWFASYEDAGTVMLALAGVLGLIVAGWLWVQLRKPAPAGAGATAATVEVDWAPHASIWPFWIGLGGTFAAIGLALSPWLLVPGMFVLLIGVVGWAGQSRRRD